MKDHQLVFVCYFFQCDSHPPPCSILGMNIKEFLVVFSQNTPIIAQRRNDGWWFANLLGTPSRMPNPTLFIQSKSVPELSESYVCLLMSCLFGGRGSTHVCT